MYSYLRFIQCAALISFGVIIGISVPPLLVAAIQRPHVAGAGISDRPAVPCDRQVLLRSDQNCLPGTTPRRAMPWTTAAEVASIAEDAPEKQATENRDAAPMPREPREGESSGTGNTPLAESQDAATVPQELAQGDATKEPRHLTSVSPAAPTIAPTMDDRSKADTVGTASATESSPEKPLAESPDAAAVSRQLARESDINGPERAMPASPVAGEKRRGPSKETQVRVPASKNKTSDRADRAAKRSTDESVKAVRRFGDGLQDIPVSAYAPDGVQRRVIIRPTSVQDVYYYSVPR